LSTAASSRRCPRRSSSNHGFAGGIPHYMLKIGKPFWQFLDAELKEKTFILDEGDFPLRYEFEDVLTSSYWRRWRLGAAPSAR